MHIPRIIIAGLSGGTGKTLVTLGIIRALTLQGLTISAYKKGPDYIDAAWLALAAQNSSYNLDPFFCSPQLLQETVATTAQSAHLACIEGNRGFCDGLDLKGSSSTAELARILAAPVVLVVDCTKMTRTAAALVLGCQRMEPDTLLAGVVINKTGTQRQRQLITRTIEEYTGLPVLGALPRQTHLAMPEQRGGLPQASATQQHLAYLDTLGDFIRDHIDLEKLMSIARTAPPYPTGYSETALHPQVSTSINEETEEQRASQAQLLAGQQPESIALSTTLPQADKQRQKSHLLATIAKQAVVAPHASTKEKPLIAYVYDNAFWQYYTENLHALQAAGALLAPISLMQAEHDWDNIDALYIGGGTPELYAQELSQTTTTHQALTQMVAQGFPLYAEGTGLLYLCRQLVTAKGSYTMSGLLKGTATMQRRPHGLGYVTGEVHAPNPYFPLGMQLRGHEFHFSSYTPAHEDLETNDCVHPAISHATIRLTKGKGIGTHESRAEENPTIVNQHGSRLGQREDPHSVDGISIKNMFAAYTQIYAPAIPSWAHAFVHLAATWRLPPRD